MFLVLRLNFTSHKPLFVENYQPFSPREKEILNCHLPGCEAVGTFFHWICLLVLGREGHRLPQASSTSCLLSTALWQF
jgi:hypothetical protein